MFPEPVHFQRPGQGGWKIKDWETANKLLGCLAPERRPAAVFTRSDGSYVQCAGSKTRLTVEARRLLPDGFQHLVFGRGPKTGTQETVECGVGPIECDSSQVLTMRDARLIIRTFLEQGVLDSRYAAEDVTQRF